MSQSSASVSFTIPSIDGSMSPLNPELLAQQERAKLDRLVNAPSSIGGWALLGKVLLGLIVGALMAVVLFVLFMAVGSLIGTAGSEV